MTDSDVIIILLIATLCLHICVSVYHRNGLWLWWWLSTWVAIEHVHWRLSPTESANFQFGAELTRMRIKSNQVSLLGSPNFIGPKCPNSDSNTSQFTITITNVNFCKKVPSALHDDVITWLGHNRKWFQGLVVCVGTLSWPWGQQSSLQRK